MSYNRPQGLRYGTVGTDRATTVQTRVTIAEMKKFSQMARDRGMSISRLSGELLRSEMRASGYMR